MFLEKHESVSPKAVAHESIAHATLNHEGIASTPVYSAPVYIVDGARTSFMKARGIPGPWTAADLAVQTGNALLMRQKITPEQIDEVILGNVVQSPDEANIARVVALRLGCSIKTPAWTVHRNCGSGMQALDSAVQSIQRGDSHLVLAGGTEAMSHAPLYLNQRLVNWLGHWRSAKSLVARIKLLTQFRLSFLKPDIALIKGLTDPTTGLNMGQTAEELAFELNITREAMDAYALQSHEKLARAIDEQCFNRSNNPEITPLIDPNTGIVYTEDNGLRRNLTLEALAKLQPVFDKPYGKVTVGNSSQITDGACLLLLASEKAVKEYKLPVLGIIKDTAWAGLEPGRMGLGPVYAVQKLLARNAALNINNIDYWEINEAFGAQVLGCLSGDASLSSEASTNKDNKDNSDKNLDAHLNPLQNIDPTRLNIDGGAIALGHPVGASGARIVLHLLNVLKQQNAKIGVAALCIGGGQGGAMWVERVSPEEV